ncbi:septal ring lytic transglycosylase RlpA family protein [Bombella sp. TMW 2.2559]|uniref:Endolytic peptidoglycan transglycosylase RlpA n=1 Tax=Bombella dulcis TaxID=2967339 RepID=A0ABT3WAW1_9PROT|nr:septal ring lytic transglycosylase RlpA family protein [Bombella dulcis]MCX5616235.1 septal ring lytic transglycosylase RlpA family protein [Bombella dulcis]
MAFPKASLFLLCLAAPVLHHPAHAAQHRRRSHQQTVDNTALIKAASTLPVTESGLASWYGNKKLAGKRTASGERFHPDAMTAAHPSLPLGTKLLVHSPSTGRSVIVRVNDRGPFGGDRIIDLSKGAAASLGIMGHGVSQITITVLPRNMARFRHASDIRNILQEEERQAQKAVQDSAVR